MGQERRSFNEEYWKALVAKGILYNRVRKLISQADWYEQGYLANITHLHDREARRKRSNDKEKARSLDIQAIWSRQDLTAATEDQAMIIAPQVYSHLTSGAGLPTTSANGPSGRSAGHALRRAHRPHRRVQARTRGGIARAARARQA